MNKFRTAGVFGLCLLENLNWSHYGIKPQHLENLKNLIEPQKVFTYQKMLDMKRNDNIKLNEDQEIVKTLVISKDENVFYTGAAGTGKSVLLQSIIKELRKKYGNRSVAVTATTGIAAINIGGQTLHSFAGLNPRSQLIGIEKLIEELSKLRKVAARWKGIKALVIDEVSMLDADLFDKLDHIAQHFRRIKEPFGGLQLVITGDFCQLPPVKKIDKDVNYCFEASSWWNSLNHAVQLTKIHRQHEQEFVEMLNEYRFGIVSHRSNLIMRQLDKTPNYQNDGIDVTELYPLNKCVDRINSAKLESLPHKSFVYEAKDWEPAFIGQLRTLKRNCLAPSTLNLKLNAQVMLIKNYTPQLVNGSKGVVIGWFSIETLNFYDEFPDNDAKFLLPVVRFINGQIKIIPPAVWQLKNEADQVVAKRRQIPLVLSWAISIHKSQGQTLERVKVDLDKVFEKGQTYVALSRATSLNSLQVLNFSPDKVFADEKVKQFYNSLTDL